MTTITAGDDFAADASTTGRLALGGQVSGNIERADDKDWFKLTLQAGVTYRFVMDGAGSGFGTLGSDGKAWLELALYDAAGQTSILRFANNAGDSVAYTYTPTVSGSYYLEAATASGKQGTGSYTLQASVANADDYAANTGTTGSLVVHTAQDTSRTTQGIIERAGDADWFRVTLQGGTAYTFTLDGALADGGGANDGGSVALLSWLDASGKLLGSTTSGGAKGTPLTVFTPATSGTYYLQASALNGSGGGSYNINVLWSAQDDYAAGTATAGNLGVGVKAYGRIEQPSDSDWFKVSLVAGVNYRFELAGAMGDSGGFGSGTSQGRLTVLNASGSALTSFSGWDGPLSGVSVGLFTPTISGTYYLQVSQYVGRGTGAYTLSMSDGLGDDYAADASTTGQIAVNGRSNGYIESAGDTDWFKVTLLAGETYYLGAWQDAKLPGSRGLGVQATWRDAGGNLVPGQVNGAFTPTSSGTYYAQVTEYTSGDRGVYSVWVNTDGLDDFGGERATAGGVAVGGEVRGNVEQTADHDMFKVALQAGVNYTIKLSGVAGPGGALGNDGALLGLDGQDSSGRSLWTAYGSYGGGFAATTFKPQVSGTYYLDVYSPDYGHGNYLLQVLTAPDSLPAYPTAVALSVPGGTSAVPLDAKLTVSFSENVFVGQGQVLLMDTAGNVLGSYDIASRAVAVSGNTLTLTPNGGLLPGTTYKLLVPSGGVKDVEGNGMIGEGVVMPGSSFSFTTVGSKNYLLGTPSTAATADALVGTAGNDVVLPLTGYDSIDGGAGTDTAVFAGKFADYWLVAGAGTADVSWLLPVMPNLWPGTDRLTNVERLRFADESVALDLGANQAGGKAVLMMGALLGAEFPKNKAFAGLFLNYFDSGATLLDGARLLVDSGILAAFAGKADERGMGGFIYANVYGHAASAAELNAFMAPVEAHTQTLAQLLATAAASAQNEAQVQLAGYARAGWEYW